MEQIFAMIYVAVMFSVAFSRYTLFTIMYIIYATSFFGLFKNYILIGGVEYGFLLANLACIPPLLLNYNHITRTTKYIIGVVLFFYFYGLLRPVFDDNQSILESIKASKSMNSYFFMFYILVYINYLNFDKIFKIFECVALYFCFLYISNYIGFHIKPDVYVKESTIGIQCLYDSFIYLALCVKLSLSNNHSLKDITICTIYVIGIFLGGFFSLFFSSIITVFMTIFFRVLKTKERFITVSMICLAVLLLMSATIENFVTAHLMEQVDAYESRNVINEFRMSLINDNPYFGYGFLSNDSPLVKINAPHISVYTEGFAVIDSGYVDLAGKFGYVGTVFFLLIPIYYLFECKMSRETIPFITLLFMFFFVCTTWSVFTYQMGIIVLTIVYAWLTKVKKRDLSRLSNYSDLGLNSSFSKKI